MATAATWYVLVYGDYVPAPGAYTLLATASNMIFTSVTPSRGSSAVETTLTLAGAGFDSTSVVELVSADNHTYPATSTSVDSSRQTTALFAAGAVPAGTYSVRVSRSLGDPAERANAFTMVQAGEAHLGTDIIAPGAVGYHQTATIWVEYANTGDAAMPAPLLVVTAAQNGQERALLTLDQSRRVEGFWTSAIPEGFSNSVQFLACGSTPGVLQPGESLRVPVYYAGWQQPWDFSYPPIEFSLGALTADDTTAADWPSLKDSMRPDTIPADAWDPIWANFTARVGSTWGGYVRMLDDNAS
jgi:hypothetical protein